jgi:signal transduction histidine kinase
VKVIVLDHGQGLPEDFRDQIFERFTQADSSDKRQSGGTGLGLSISAAIAEAHGGRLDFNSVTGEGSSFYFNLKKIVA